MRNADVVEEDAGGTAVSGAVAAAPGPDDDILRLVADGDVAAAFALVMERYQGKVYRLCVAYMRDRGRAEDVAQDSLVRVWRALSRFDGRASLATFVYVIARNRCLSALGARRLGDAGSPGEMELLAAADVQAGRDRDRALRQLVAELPDMTRRIVTLYYFEEQSVAAVAALAGLPEGTVKTHLFRARRRLLARCDAVGLGSLAHWQEG